MKKFLAYGRSDFLAGLAVVLPVAVSIAAIIWLFGTVTHLTDTLLLLVPGDWIQKGNGSLHLYARILALLAAILLIMLVGRAGRYYFGKKLIRAMNVVLSRVPLLNRIHTALKQIHEAFTSTKTSSFKQVVLVEFPRPGLYSIGFITSAQNAEVQEKIQKQLVCVFVPTAPLTSGSVVLVPEAEVVKLDMSVADGLKFIMSLGSVSPTHPSEERVLTGAAGGSKRPGIGASCEADGSLVSPALSPKLAGGSGLSAE